MRLARSGVREARIARLRVASSIQRAIRKDPYDAEAVTQVAEDGVTIEPGRTERVDGPASFDTNVAPPRADEPRDEDLQPVPIRDDIVPLQREQAARGFRRPRVSAPLSLGRERGG